MWVSYKVENLIEKQCGPLAHLVEHLICNEGVAGSTPVRSTKRYEKIYFYVSGSLYPDSFIYCCLL